MWSVLLVTLAFAKPPKEPVKPVDPGPDIATRWMRDSEEYRVLAEQTYRMAQGSILSDVAALPAGAKWAVVMDADETAIDNIQYQVENVDFSEPTWEAWELRAEAKATPGARAFTDAIHKAGGTIAYVTNRHDAASAQLALEKNGLFGPDDRMCTARKDEAAGKWISDKRERRTEVRTGTGACSWGAPVLVIGYFGDQMGDFPEADELAADPLGYSPWGRSYFMLPNPMYGKWERTPNRTTPW
jgi:5'-nucleotidase (lipoprotein e(P4) family)